MTRLREPTLNGRVFLMIQPVVVSAAPQTYPLNELSCAYGITISAVMQIASGEAIMNAANVKMDRAQRWGVRDVTKNEKG